MSQPFFTLVDPNVRVKGARDPLGTLSVWTALGRRVVTNLTTQTTSLNDFRVLLIGAWLMDELSESSERETDPFLVWEQLAGYARYGHRESFRGIERVGRNLADGTVTVSADPAHQILTGQRAYGVWGLYSAAAKRCGLLTPILAQRIRPQFQAYS